MSDNLASGGRLDGGPGTCNFVFFSPIIHFLKTTKLMAPPSASCAWSKIRVCSAFMI